MDNIPTEVIQLGAVAILFFFAMKEFFSYLKIKKNGNGDYVTQLALINQKLDNHIAHICSEITEIKEAVKDIKDDIVDIKIKIQ